MKEYTDNKGGGDKLIECSSLLKSVIELLIECKIQIGENVMENELYKHFFDEFARVFDSIHINTSYQKILKFLKADKILITIFKNTINNLKEVLLDPLYPTTKKEAR